MTTEDANRSPTGAHIPPGRSLKPPQFGLRTLLWLVAACALLLALRPWLSPLAIVALAFLGASMFCHVAGNALGTRLRQIGDQPELPPAPLAIRRTPLARDFAPVTRLGERRSLGWAIVVATSVGLTSGAVGGGLWTFVVSHGQAGALNIAVGVVAFSVLGGLASFAVVAFLQVLLGAIWQALATAKDAVPQDRG